MRTAPVAALTLAMALAACTAATSGPGPTGTRLRALHSVPGISAIDVLVDGQVVLQDVTSDQPSAYVDVSPGTHTLGIRASGSQTSLGHTTVTWAAQTDYTLFTIDSTTIVNPIVLTDTGATVPPGQSKLRVVHFAARAPAIDVWRTQPDYPTPVRIMFPFPYRAASPYLQSTPGDWSVFVTPEGGSDTLFAAAPVPVPDGAARTVVLLDADGGGMRAVVLDDAP